jgi:hypothetical protein
MLVRLCSPQAREQSTCPTWNVPVQEFFGGKLSPDFRRIFSSVSVRLWLTLSQTSGYDRNPNPNKLLLSYEPSSLEILLEIEIEKKKK